MTGQDHGTTSSDRRVHWLSQDLQQLIEQCQQPPTGTFHFDLVIVGSGYGGAIAAAELAGHQQDGRLLRVCILERGKEYLPGMFPSRMADLPGHVRFSTPNQPTPGGQREGLFDLRIGTGLNTLLGNGLGGGSLINAGVMIEPKPDVFDHRWPTALRYSENPDFLNTTFAEVKQKVGAATAGADNTISRHADHQQQPLSKRQQLNLLATDKHQSSVYDAAITVAMGDTPSSAGIPLKACKLCGDCATGCNYNAKESLDTNLLVQARQKGAEIFTGATVLDVTPLLPGESTSASNGWVLSVVHTNERRRHIQTHPLQLTAGKVIIAAGALGSTEILMRSQKKGLKLSSKLGQGFSSNGDMLANIFNQKVLVNAVAKETTSPDQRHIGPTITGVIDLRDHPSRVLIEEMAVPGPLRRLYEELVTSVDSIADIHRKDESVHRFGQPEQDPWSVSEERIERTGIYAIMGDDGSRGSLELTDKDGRAEVEGDGAIQVHWPSLPDHPLFERQIDALQTLVDESDLKGKVQGNPSWKPLPDDMAALVGGGRGPLLTVHPLGGCRMGDDADNGVVDDCGRVFDVTDASTDSVYEGLVVLDGAVVPSALGANPALTIAAIALRAARELRQQWQWQYEAPVSIDPQLQQRPVFQEVEPKPDPTPTEIEITERITGAARLTDHNGQPTDCVIDITMRFHPKPVLDLIHRTERKLEINRAQEPGEPVSQVRIFEPSTWDRLIRQGATDETFSEQALLVAPVSGTLEIMGRDPSSYRLRLRRGIRAWAPNRGLRDTYQSLERFLRKSRRPARAPLVESPLNPLRWPAMIGKGGSAAGRKRQEVLAVASHAGEMRLFDYQLTMERPESGWPQSLSGFSGQTLTITGRKEISYTRAGNPLRQFEDMYLEEFPGLQPVSAQASSKRPWLRFDSRFVTHYNKPLIRITRQEDQVAALTDMASFGTYFLRGILHQHLWSLRKPDAAKLSSNRRLPGSIKGIHPPEITELTVDTYDLGMRADIPIRMRLTRYPQPSNRPSTQPPLVFFHGYSASGNTFTHPALKPSMAEYFWHQGRDVWVVDLRTSSGMQTALLPWSFEDVAFADIPVAIDHICRHTEQGKVDVVAHCMGSAMFSMAVLAPPDASARYYQERLALPDRINKAVLSQVGPRVVFTPENIFRAYGLSYAQQLLPQLFYRFQRGEAPSAPEQLLDRLLCGLPYPDGEFELENPIWPWAKTSYVATRRRMDALYGRTFSLRNLSKQTLAHIDDLFGPLSMATLSQTIRFALNERITNKYGENEFVTRERLQQRWLFPTMSVHGDENGLADISTLGRMEETMWAAKRNYRTQVLKGFGHQDSLIGIGCERNFDVISDFLREAQPMPAAAETTAAYRLGLPLSGPLYRPEKSGVIQLGIGFDTQMNKPEFVLFLPVNRQHEQLRCAAADSSAEQISASLRAGAVLKFAYPAKDNWLKTRLALTRAMKDADGILIIVIDDLGLELSEILELQQLPANLFELLEHKPVPPQWRVVRDYVEQQLLGNAFAEQLQDFLAQPARQLEDALIQPPKKPDGTSLALVLGACQYPSGMLDRKPAFTSYRRLAGRLEEASADKPTHLGIFTGDQVYADATAGLLDPTDRFNRFVDAYHRWLRQPEVKSVFRRLPALTMLDDHEVVNDWNAAFEDSHQRHLLGQGKANYINFQRPDLPAISAKEAEAARLWYAFSDYSFDMFMMDTRTERQGRAKIDDKGLKQVPQPELISSEQKQAFTDWLSSTKTDDHQPRFVVSPSMLLPRRLCTAQAGETLRSDAWDGYPDTMKWLLELIAEGEHRNLIFLSGDEHLSSVVDINLTAATLSRPIQLHSIHSSGLYAPLPFVNSTPALFAEEEAFTVNDEGLSCSVRTTFVPGNGFALINTRKENDQWKLTCEFDREGQPQDVLELTLDQS